MYITEYNTYYRMVTYVTAIFYIITCHKEDCRRFWNNIRVKDSKLYLFLFLLSFILFIFLFLNLELEVSIISYIKLHMSHITVTYHTIMYYIKSFKIIISYYISITYNIYSL